MRLIDADALKRILIDKYNFFPFFVKNAIDNAPTIDAVEVVRCGGCKYSMLWREPSAEAIADCVIRKMNSEDEQFCMVGADDFCSYGERRTECD